MLKGQKLLRKSGEVVNADEVLAEKKIIAYYFSAHWCPPCRNFTPILADFYNVSTSKLEISDVTLIRSNYHLGVDKRFSRADGNYIRQLG